MSGDRTPRSESSSARDLACLAADRTDWNLQFRSFVLGQLFLLACVAATLSIAGILFVLFGPVPVRRRVTLVPRLHAAVAPSFVAPIAPIAPAASSNGPSLVSQLAPAPEQDFAPTVREEQPIAAAAIEVPPLRKPKGAKVEPLPRKRSARGTNAPSPFAPVVRSGRRQVREEDAATNPVRLFDSDELTVVDG